MADEPDLNPTTTDILGRADAFMRRRRSAPAATDEDIPLLTDIVSQATLPPVPQEGPEPAVFQRSLRGFEAAPEPAPLLAPEPLLEPELVPEPKPEFEPEPAFEDIPKATAIDEPAPPPIEDIFPPAYSPLVDIEALTAAVVLTEPAAEPSAAPLAAEPAPEAVFAWVPEPAPEPALELELELELEPEPEPEPAPITEPTPEPIPAPVVVAAQDPALIEELVAIRLAEALGDYRQDIAVQVEDWLNFDLPRLIARETADLTERITQKAAQELRILLQTRQRD